MSNIIYRAAFVGTATMGSMIAQSSIYEATMQDGVYAYVHPFSENVLYAGADIEAGGARTSLRTSLISLDVGRLDAISNATSNGVVDISADAHVSSIGLLNINGYASVIGSAQIDPYAGVEGFANLNPIIANALSVSASGVTGDGAAMVLSIGEIVDSTGFVSHTASGDYTGFADNNVISKLDLSGSSDVDASGVSLSVSGITADGAALVLSDTVDVIGISKTDLLGMGSIIGSTSVDADAKHIIEAYSDIEVEGLSLSVSGITADGAALVLSNVTSTTAIPSSTVNANGDVEGYSSSVIQGLTNQSASIDPILGTGINVSAGSIIGLGVGSFISDVVDVETTPHNEADSFADISIPSVVDGTDVNPTTDKPAQASIIGIDTTITAPGVVGLGSAVVIAPAESDATSIVNLTALSDIEVSSDISSVSFTRMDTSAETTLGSAITFTASGVTGYGAAAFLTDVTTIEVNPTIIALGSGDSETNADLDVIANTSLSGSGDIEVDGLNSSIAGVVGDGAGVVVTLIEMLGVEPTLESFAISDIDSEIINKNVTLENDDDIELEESLDVILSEGGVDSEKSFVDVNATHLANVDSENIDASGISISASGITGYGAGVFIANAVLVDVDADLIVAVEADDGRIISAAVDSISTISANSIASIDGSGISVTVGAVTGDGAAMVLSDPTDLDATSIVNKPGFGIIVASGEASGVAVHEINIPIETIDASGANVSGGAITGYGAGVFITSGYMTVMLV